VIEDVRVVEVRLPELHGALQGRRHEVVFIHRPHVAHVRHPVALDQAPHVGRGA
jgi:hypothetical protein